MIEVKQKSKFKGQEKHIRDETIGNRNLEEVFKEQFGSEIVE